MYIMRLLLVILLIMNNRDAYSQYGNVSIEKMDTPGLRIIQLDQYENSTIIHFTFRNFTRDEFVYSGDMHPRFPLIITRFSDCAF